MFLKIEVINKAGVYAGGVNSKMTSRNNIANSVSSMTWWDDIGVCGLCLQAESDDGRECVRSTIYGKI